ncbi:MAG TPA: D-2-hydroxyacid dehydrogenase [Candidatus Saccharimonadia bacterium]|nr:D-2-hydroxyacid dehydrogenase [Candidatus Saccharimonadia bacterium]
MSNRFRLLVCAGLLSAAGAVAAKGAPDPRATALIAELGLKPAAVASRDLPGWKSPTRVVVATDDGELVTKLQSLVPGVEVLAAAEDDAARGAQLAEAQVVVGLCDAETLAAAKSLHWIQALWVGVENCVSVPGLAERGIVLTNMQRTSGRPIAEHAIALMLALSRGLPQFARHQHAGRWQRDPAAAHVMREVGGRTMLVVGLGGIGTEVARRGHALGMRVIATRNSTREGPDFVAKVGLPGDLLAYAAEADVVVNAVPLTPSTTGIFNRAFFDAMKPDGLFVNVARGRSVVTDDLVAALRSGRLAGAALDVTDPEPLPDGHALWSMPNVVITPHVAAESSVQGERDDILIAENLRRYVAGEPLLNVVDIARGY